MRGQAGKEETSVYPINNMPASKIPELQLLEK
jgi:hypothetical protein